MSEKVKVWLGIDPETGRMLLLLNGQPVGTLTGAGKHLQVNIDPEYESLREDLTRYCSALFFAMPETLAAAVFETPSFVLNRVAGDIAETIPADLRKRIHLGSGPDKRAGWLNVDYLISGPPGFNAANGVLNYDLRWGLPLFEDGSVDLFFSSHFFEHLRHEETMRLLTDCRRLLRKGGILRFQMPDFRQTFRAYVANDEAWLDKVLTDYNLLGHMPEYSQNFADLVSVSVYEGYTHKYIWDENNLSKALKAVGFSEVIVDTYQEGLDNPGPGRVDYSYYLSAVA